jgi:hypothetical protein
MTEERKKGVQSCQGKSRGKKERK